MRVVEEDKIDKVAAMKKTYKDAKLDCLLCLGGHGPHKTANLLSQEGLNIIGLPKTCLLYTSSPADKAILRSNPGRIAREINAVCGQKGRSDGVQCL